MTDKLNDQSQPHSTPPLGAPQDRVPEQQHQQPAAQGPRHGHRLMMLICCLPMLLIVGILVATGAAGSGAILYALLCTAMMAAMMFAMPGGHKH
jgi:hypothetical protein